MDLWTAVLDWVLPAACPGCGAPCAAALCPACTGRLIAAPAAGPPAQVDWWASPFAYEGPLRELLAGLKYRNRRAGLGWMAEAVAASVRAGVAAAGAGLDTVTWPPTTAARARQRGFDQAEHLARAVARELGLPARSLLRRQPGAAQTGRSRADRARGPSFVAHISLPGQRLLVVDDVATTGATLAAAALALRAAGASSVAAATAGRTPRRGDGHHELGG